MELGNIKSPMSDKESYRQLGYYGAPSYIKSKPINKLKAEYLITTTLGNYPMAWKIASTLSDKLTGVDKQYWLSKKHLFMNKCQYTKTGMQRAEIKHGRIA